MPESPGTDLAHKTLDGDGRTVQDLRDQYPDTRERETLKVWHYHAIAKKYIYGLTWEEVGKIFNKSKGYLSSLACSPAGRRFREKIQNMEPEQIAEITLKAASVNATQDYMMALEWAKEARDYQAVHRMTKDLLDFADVGSKKDQGSGGRTIHIHLDAKDLESPEIETDFQVLDAEVLDED